VKNMALTKVQGQTWHVVGAGKSGVAAAELLARHGANVVLLDEKPLAAWSVRPTSAAVRGEQVSLATFDASTIARCVVSPGVPPGPWTDALDARGVPVWSEIELAWQLRAGDEPVVAIGGTNGKSTTTSLVAHVLAAAGKRVFAGGNLGEPWANHDAEPFDAAVIEVSSFQLERVIDFRPKVSVLLNVTPDHLDRYPSFEHYAAAKGRAFERQTPGDLAVVPAGDDVCRWQAVRGRGALATFGTDPSADVSVQGARIEDRARGIVVDLERTRLRGGHNALNVAATLAALRPFALEPALVVDAIGTFEGLAHRTALAGTVAGVRYYDDSKGTNVGAAVTALVGLLEPKAVLIAGGKDKGGSYEPLVEALRAKGRAVVTLGEAAPLIEAALGSAVPWTRATSMEDAVRLARAYAQPGDAVLLSPACASFDMFRDYKHRGDAFVEAVRALEEGAR
jgi:UDP-N-acetylmuramoylalanine--D-glutamate ligase